jgi:hypothetical protein
MSEDMYFLAGSIIIGILAATVVVLLFWIAFRGKKKRKVIVGCFPGEIIEVHISNGEDEDIIDMVVIEELASVGKSSVKVTPIDRLGVCELIADNFKIPTILDINNIEIKNGSRYYDYTK